VLITYGDQIQSSGEPPLRTLHRFLRSRMAGLVSAVHLLPISPWSSDDGFAVIDYSKVDPALGDWGDVSRIAADHEVMLDVVLNHASSRHRGWPGSSPATPSTTGTSSRVPAGTDVSTVVRPRARPLLTAFDGPAGRRLLWTTFSPDQVDLNFGNPRVLRRMVEVLLDDIEHGATLLRLDAVGYTWKEPGTPCINLPRTHHLCGRSEPRSTPSPPARRSSRRTNVAQPENIAYFGDGAREAQVVYQFSCRRSSSTRLLFGTAERLAPWISSLPSPPPGCAFLNMVATHDRHRIDAGEGTAIGGRGR
jgi:sucrose phosphorylase